MIPKPSHFLAGALLCAGSSCVIELGDYSGSKVQKDVELSHAIAGDVKEIFVDSYNGSVTIEAGPAGAVNGTSRLHARGRSEEAAQARLDSMTWSFSEQANGRLVLRLAEPVNGGSNNAGGSATLTVPAGLRVFVDTSNGGVEVRGAFPYAWVDTGNGPVTLDGVQEVEVDTSNGAVHVTGANGKVFADTSNGPIIYRGASADFTLDTSNGNVDVTLTGDWSGQGEADTSNGEVTVQCTGVLDCTMSASTSNGKVYSPKLEGGRGKLLLDTSNGNVTVKQGVAQ